MHGLPTLADSTISLGHPFSRSSLYFWIPTQLRNGVEAELLVILIWHSSETYIWVFLGQPPMSNVPMPHERMAG